VEAIARLFDPSLSPRRLSAIGWIAAASEDESLAERLDQLIRGLIETVAGTEAMEAFSNLANALNSLDASRSKRTVAVAEIVFFDRRLEATSPDVSAWRSTWRSRPHLDKADYDGLIKSGGDDARAAVQELYCLGEFKETGNPIAVRLDDTAMRQFQKLAESEQELRWQVMFAVAAARVESTALLPWLLSISSSPELHRPVHQLSPIYGPYVVCGAAEVMRAIGYLTRRLLDQKAPHRSPGLNRLLEPAICFAAAG
jgi:hypothetical protein